jgi:hypothetical protein
MFRRSVALFSIADKNKVVCITCIHYRRPPEAKIKDGLCSAYGKKDLVTGFIKYESAKNARKYPSMCGKDGNNYEELFHEFLPKK